MAGEQSEPADPFTGEIRLFGFSRVPSGWVACDGALLPIAQYPKLYKLLDTVYGGDGKTTFGVPDLRGRVPIHQGEGHGLTARSMGQSGGEERHTLTTEEMPSHGHALLSTTNVGTTPTPGTNVHLAASSLATAELYAPQSHVPSYNIMAPSVGPYGRSLAHENRMATLTCNICICHAGIFPEKP